jgi:hypothetical protein
LENRGSDSHVLKSLEMLSGIEQEQMLQLLVMLRRMHLLEIMMCRCIVYVLNRVFPLNSYCVTLTDCATSGPSLRVEAIPFQC